MRSSARGGEPDFLKIELKELQKGIELLAEYLSSKTSTKVKVQASSIELQNVSDKDAKLLLHKYLHQRGLDAYRVVVAHPGLIEVLPPESRPPHVAREQGSPPSAAVTMPYYFPGSGGSMPRSKKRKK